MIEHAVENHFDIMLPRLLTQFYESIIPAEHFVHGQIVACVVFVVGIRVKNGGEVDCFRSESGNIVELFGNSVEISAEEDVIRHLRTGVFAVLRDSVVPVLVQLRAILYSAASASLESVDENVIDDAFSEALRRFVRAVVDQNLPLAYTVFDGFKLANAFPAES